MTDDIAELNHILNLHETRAAATGREILNRLEAEIARLRENALGLGEVPDGWSFTRLTRIGDAFECCLTNDAGRFLIESDGEIYGTGPTPKTALDAAIERIAG